MTRDTKYAIISIMKLNTELIRDIMRGQNITQTALAYKMDARRQWVHAVLTSNGNKSHTLRTIQKIADALGVDPITLIKRG